MWQVDLIVIFNRESGESCESSKRIHQYHAKMVRSWQHELVAFSHDLQ